MQTTLLFWAGAVIVVTGIAHAISGATIEKIRAVARDAPARLKGVTSAEALAKADEFERNRRRLWPSGLVVAAGLAAAAFILR